MKDNNPFGDMPVIYSYTRKQAIEDGVLVDLSAWAHESGFTVPVACTVAVWHEYIVPPEGTRELGQSERGRCHDLLFVLYTTIRRKSTGDDQLTFEVIFVNKRKKQETVTLKAICGPGDDGEPVMTILRLDED